MWLYRDSAAILNHSRLADPCIAKVTDHCEIVEFQIHGEPSAKVLQRMRDMLDDGRASQASSDYRFKERFEKRNAYLHVVRISGPLVSSATGGSRRPCSPGLPSAGDLAGAREP